MIRRDFAANSFASESFAARVDSLELQNFVQQIEYMLSPLGTKGAMLSALGSVFQLELPCWPEETAHSPYHVALSLAELRQMTIGGCHPVRVVILASDIETFLARSEDISRDSSVTSVTKGAVEWIADQFRRLDDKVEHAREKLGAIGQKLVLNTTNKAALLEAFNYPFALDISLERVLSSLMYDSCVEQCPFTTRCYTDNMHAPLRIGTVIQALSNFHYRPYETLCDLECGGTTSPYVVALLTDLCFQGFGASRQEVERHKLLPAAYRERIRLYEQHQINSVLPQSDIVLAHGGLRKPEVLEKAVTRLHKTYGNPATRFWLPAGSPLATALEYQPWLRKRQEQLSIASFQVKGRG